MTRAEDAKTRIERALDDALAAIAPGAGIAATLERPRDPAHGDYASNVALMAGKRVNRKPRELAVSLSQAILPRLAEDVAKTEIAGPGFLNVYLTDAARQAVVPRILAQGAAFGRGEALAGQRIMVEFVSANPTGPLHVGHGRQAALGDAIAKLLQWQGANVTR